MRILVHSSTPVCPYYEGTSLRTFHITPYLAREHELDLIQERWSWEDQVMPISPTGYTEEWLYEYYRQVINVWHQPGEQLRYRFLWKSPTLYQTLDRLLETNSYDVIYAPNEIFPLYQYDRSRSSRNKTAYPGSLVGPTDSAHLHYWRDLQTTRSLKEIGRIFIKWGLYTIYQVQVLNRMPYWIMVTERDARSMQTLSRKNRIFVVPYGVDADWFAPRGDHARDPNCVTFVGTLGPKSPNEESVLRLLSNVWPHVISVISQAKLVIIGRNPSRRLIEECNRSKNVSLIGYTQDIRPFLWSSGTVILPICAGSGIKNKFLEAWAAGCAVVSTKIGVEGIEHVCNGENAIIVDNLKQMIEALIDLILSEVKQKRLSKAGMRTINEYYRWDIVAGRITQSMCEIIETVGFVS